VNSDRQPNGDNSMGKFDNIPLSLDDFAAETSTHTIMTGPQLKRLFGTKAERQAFIDLMKIITKRTNEANKLTEITKNMRKYAGVLLKLARKAALG
ncbi:MAG: hypothetical protein JSV91_14590, partial [Phycisphaerales bacterium]